MGSTGGMEAVGAPSSRLGNRSSTSTSEHGSPGYPDSAEASIQVHLALLSSALDPGLTWGLHPVPVPVCCPESSILPQFPCPRTGGSIQPRSPCPGPSHSPSCPPLPAPPAPYRERSRGKSRRLRRRRVAWGRSPERPLPARAPAPAGEAAPGPALGIGHRGPGQSLGNTGHESAHKEQPRNTLQKITPPQEKKSLTHPFQRTAPKTLPKTAPSGHSFKTGTTPRHPPQNPPENSSSMKKTPNLPTQNSPARNSPKTTSPKQTPQTPFLTQPPPTAPNEAPRPRVLSVFINCCSRWGSGGEGGL